MCSFMNSFSLGENRSYFEPGQRTWYKSAQALAQAAIQNAGFELLRHPPYSPFVFVLHGK